MAIPQNAALQKIGQPESNVAPVACFLVNRASPIAIEFSKLNPFGEKTRAFFTESRSVKNGRKISRDR